MADAHPFFTDLPVHPPIDPGVKAVFDAFAEASQPLSDDTIHAMRQLIGGAPLPDLTVDGRVIVEDRTIPGPVGAPALEITVFTPAKGASSLPGIYFIHGGAMVLGHRLNNIEDWLPYVAEGLAVVATVEYRLAPEHRAPAQVEDCYAGLLWFAQHAEELSVDPQRLIIAGISAGGGLALGCALMSRDRGGPAMTHQVLIAPMIEDRFIHPSNRMLDAMPGDRNDNLWSWRTVLGDDFGSDDVSPYVAPARAEDVSDLPRTYIEFGDVEAFRDELLTLCLRLSQAGVQVDAHMWGGGTHGFSTMAPHLSLSQEANATRDAFVRRMLAG